MICMLLPVLKQISEDPDIELEPEVKSKGSNNLFSCVVYCSPLLILYDGPVLLLYDREK